MVQDLEFKVHLFKSLFSIAVISHLNSGKSLSFTIALFPQYIFYSSIVLKSKLYKYSVFLSQYAWTLIFYFYFIFILFLFYFYLFSLILFFLFFSFLFILFYFQNNKKTHNYGYIMHHIHYIIGSKCKRRSQKNDISIAYFVRVKNNELSLFYFSS